MLMVICARKLIRNIGIGGIVWGVFNIVFGVVAIQATIINVGILILGVLMLGTGVQALRNPSLGVLLTETIVSVLLFVWNVGIAVLNQIEVGTFEPRGLIFPLIIAGVIGNYYRKLGHLREEIASIDPGKIEAAKQVCKTLLKKKLKDEPLLVQTADRKCRVQLMDGQAFFIQNDLLRAFVGSTEAIRSAIAKPEAKAWKLVFNHPVGKLGYNFDRKNSEKIKSWLASRPVPAAV